MTVLLNNPYGSFASGSIIELPASTEAVLIAQGLATNSVAAVTVGPYTTSQSQGTCGIAAAGTSVVITNPLVTASSKIYAVLAQSAADTTATGVRVVAAAGSFTIFLNAASTAAVALDWAIVPAFGIPAQ